VRAESLQVAQLTDREHRAGVQNRKAEARRRRRMPRTGCADWARSSPTRPKARRAGTSSRRCSASPKSRRGCCCATRPTRATGC
jgi:hypothetical protein